MSRHVSHEPTAPILDVRELEVAYDGRVALRDISFQLEKGERVAVVGPNGAGKSTLFKAIAGLLPARKGSVQIFGSGPHSHTCIAYVPQRSEVDWTFPVSVFDAVMMGRIAELGLFRRAGAKERAWVTSCLDVVGLGALARRQIGELSGGQQQRLFLARAIAQHAALILMDEPTTGLDQPSQRAVLGLLDEMKQRGATVMVALHDLDLAARAFDRVLLLNGLVAGFGRAEEVLSPERLARVYGPRLQRIETTDGPVVVEDRCATCAAAPTASSPGKETP